MVSKLNNCSISFDSSKNATVLTVTGNDPYFSISYSDSAKDLFASDFPKLRITYMVPTGQSSSNFSYALYPCAGTISAPTAQAQIYKTTGIIADGAYHTLEIDLSQYSFWTGKINLIRFDFFNDSRIGDVFYITSFELVK